MNTDNLQEMIKADVKKSIFSDENHFSSNRDDDGTNGSMPILIDSLPATHGNNVEKIDPPIHPFIEKELIAQESATEADLIAYTKFLHTRMALSTIQCYWLIGKSILSFYQGKYGTGELQKISEATGIGRDTLTKACKFARQYTEDQMKHILKGKFVLSWFELTQSLSVAPQNLIAVYQASGSPGEFHNAIINLKPPAPRRTKEILGAGPKGSQIAEDTSNLSKDAENPVDIQTGRTTVPVKQISSNLETEVSGLKFTIAEKDRQIADLQDLLERKNQELGILDDAVNSLRRFLGKIRLDLEMKSPHAVLFEIVSKEEWVYEKRFGYLKVKTQGAEIP